MGEAMPPAIAAAAIGAVGAIGGGLIASSGAKSAAKAQTKAADAGIAEQRRQFDIAQANFAPFRTAGLGGLTAYQNLLGLNGNQAAAAAIAALKGSPVYQSLYRNGLETTLQNASATGGIRGGNAQASLYNLGEDTLSRVIQNQLGDLAPLISIGSGATGQLAGLGANEASNISNLLGQIGQAQAGSSLTQGGIWSGVLSNLASSIASKIGPGASGGTLGGGYNLGGGTANYFAQQNPFGGF